MAHILNWIIRSFGGATIFFVSQISDALIYKEESAFVLLPSHYYIPEFLELIICPLHQ